MNVNVAPEVANTLKELGFPYVPNDTINPAWHPHLKESRLLSKFEINGDDCTIEFVNGVFRFKPIQLSERFTGIENYTELIAVAKYVPLFDKLSIEFIQPDWDEPISFWRLDFTGEQLVKYLTLTQQVSEYRKSIIELLEG